MISALSAEVRGLRAENQVLLDKIEGLEQKSATKNSRNSSKPPSTDLQPAKRTKSLRKASGRKPGGQRGHKGGKLEMVKDPDVIDDRIPDYCTSCGSGLSEAEARPVNRRQLIDIPPIAPVVTEERVYERTCTCGHITCGEFSPNANAPVGYGPNTEALVAYLHARQYLPVARMGELFKDVLGLPISTGGICHLLDRFAQKTAPIYEEIKERLQDGPFVGSDETGCKVNGKLTWFWTWQSPQSTYIAHSMSRGKKAVDENFPNGFPNAVLGSDAWSAQLNTPAKGHQLCLAHMLRELVFMMETYRKDTWSKKFDELLRRALEIRYKMRQDATLCSNPDRQGIMGRFDQLLTEPPDPGHKKVFTFYKRMVKNRDHIFTFLADPSVPPDNNSSERAIRNIKVKQKISGQFKSERSAMNFAKIRSVVDTIIKNSQGVLEAMRLIARTQVRTAAELPL